MKDDARDSLVEFQSSIFDASDGHQLVDFIRKKKGLRSQPQKIFDDVETDRQSLQIEIQRLDEDEITIKTEEPEEPEKVVEPEVVDNEVQSTNAINEKADSSKSPRRQTIKSPGVRLKRLTHSIGRRTLLKEFERTLQESRFLPATCSTPLSVELMNPPVSPINTVNEKALSKATSMTQEKSLNLNLVCTPITITDEESPLQTTAKDPCENNQTKTASNYTEDVMRDLQMQNDLLLELANSDEEIVGRGQNSPEPHDTINDRENPPSRRSSTTSTPIKTAHRQTYTVHRDSTSNRIILSPDKSREERSVRQPLLPKTPVKNMELHTKKLIVTPEQKKLLLSKFGRNVAGSPPRIVNVQKISRIPVIMKGTTTNAPSGECQDVGQPDFTYQIPEHGETAQIIKQLQKSAPANAPVIVIPVNQTFNQAPRDTNQTAVKPLACVSSPNSNEISSTTTTTVPQTEEVATTTANKNASTSVNSLRLEDIITEDDSSSSDENQPLGRLRLLKDRETRKSSNTKAKQRLSTRNERKLSLRAPPPRSSSRHVRELMTPHQLSQMSVGEILDLRKRNSRGELRMTLHLSKRESSMFDKQVELELLRRNIQERNYEDEVLQMEVLPPPPDEFCDKRNSFQKHNSFELDVPPIGYDLVDEISSDRISMSQDLPRRFSLSLKGVKQKKKNNKKMSQQLEKYLEASQIVSNSKSKYLNWSKRKLYSKGNSEPTSSDDDSSPRKLRSDSRRSKQRQLSKTPMKPDERVPVVSSDSGRIPAAIPTSSPTSPPPHRSTPSHDFPLENKSKENKRFLPNEEEIFKLPVGRPPKKAKKTQLKSQSPSRSRSLAVKKGKKSRTVPQSSSPSPPRPVDPDEITSTNSNMDENSTVRRSKRERKPLSAYWSCSQKEYRPLYDISSILAAKRNASMLKQKDKRKADRKAKNVPSSEDNLVANTKTSRSNSVDKTQIQKSSNEKQNHQKRGPKQSKRGEDTTNSVPTKSRQEIPSDGTTSPSECPLEDIPVQLPNILEDTESDRHHTTSKVAELKKPLKSKSKKKQHSTDALECPSVEDPPQLPNITKNVKTPATFKSKGTKSKKKLNSIDTHASSSDCSSEDHHPSSIQQVRLRTIAEDSTDARECPSVEDPPQLPTITENVETPATSKSKGTKSKKKLNSIDTHASSSDCPSEDLHPSSIQQVRLRTIEENLTDARECPSIENPPQLPGITENLETPATSKSKGAKSKKRLNSIDSHANSSGCLSEDYPSSIQQVRLTTIAEDSLPGLSEQVAISVSDLDKTNRIRLSSEIMPPPPSRVIQKKSKVFKKTKKDAFRTDHDESIADASSVHVNKLFDQLKSSSMCVAPDDTALQVTNSGQVSQGSRANEFSAKTSKCKNLTVRLLRMKGKKTSSKSSEKVCDSGFSSEDMSSDPKQKGDILLNWLKQIVRNGRSPSDSQKGVARFLQSDGFHTASIDDLMFHEIDGVDYAFYNTKQQFSFGYMRFNPRTEKKKCTAKKFELNFVVLCGAVKITANGNTFDCKNGDLITVFIGTSYGIKNISNDPALVMVIKK